MYIRIAQFESDPGAIDGMLDNIRGDLDRGRDAASSGQVPDEMAGLEGVRRVMILVDRTSGRNAGLTFCETEEELRQADEALNRMSPGEGVNRTSVGLYEVAIDQEMGR